MTSIDFFRHLKSLEYGIVKDAFVFYLLQATFINIVGYILIWYSHCIPWMSHKSLLISSKCIICICMHIYINYIYIISMMSMNFEGKFLLQIMQASHHQPLPRPLRASALTKSACSGCQENGWKMLAEARKNMELLGFVSRILWDMMGFSRDYIYI